MSEQNASGGMRRLALPFILGAAIAGGSVYGLADRIKQTIHRVPAEQRLTVNYRQSNVFLDTNDGRRIQIYQGKEGPIFSADYIAANAQPEELEKVIRAGLGNLAEQQQEGIVIYGLRELQEENRKQAIQEGLDYCKLKTQVSICGRVVEDIGISIHNELKDAYGKLRDRIVDP